ncbi:MAG TPA: ATP-binding protein [Cyclobacteriaceae bacterium]|nr:ATP-binding protein [Cyclobacteriaceae bacterium]
MLIEFTIGNYLSFKEKRTLSLEASRIREHPESVILTGSQKLLRSAVIYGANSSGKSNLIKGLETMFEIIKTSASKSSADEIAVNPFLLDDVSSSQPSHFEILFKLGQTNYRYGFEADKKKIWNEWFYVDSEGHEKLMFIRTNDSIEVTDEFPEGQGLEEKTRDNALFLSVVDQFNGETAKKIMNWVRFTVIFSGIEHEKVKGLTSAFLRRDGLSKDVRMFLRQLNLGFLEFEIEELDSRTSNVLTVHNKYNQHGEIIDKVKFDLQKQESKGTNKLFDMAASIVSGLLLGSLTVVDELDAKLHPVLTSSIVRLFNSPETNPSNAQLIFATHDTNLLSGDIFRRDQIWFTEKNQVESTDLYSLVEYKEPDGVKVRNDRSFEKDYINGRYGAIPFIGDFSNLVGNGTEREN